MPRGWRPKPTEEEKLAAAKKNVADIIDHAKIDQGIKYDKDLAEMIGLSRATFSAKKKDGTWRESSIAECYQGLCDTLFSFIYFLFSVIDIYKTIYRRKEEAR